MFVLKRRPASTLASKLVASLVIALLAGCAHQSASIQTASIGGLSSKNECTAIDTRDDSAVARVLDINDIMLTALRKFGKTDNAGVCAMTWDERNNVMLAHRNTLKDPNRKALRAPSKEYIRTWDADDNGNQPTSTQKLLADTKRRAMGIENAVGLTKAAGIRQNNWTFLGPGNIGGRIRAIVFDPRNSNRFFIGAATGGIWLTTDAGQTIRPVADFSGNLAIGAMAIDPVNPDIVYAGTGESFAGFAGVGIFKSTDSGLTWNLLTSTSTDTAVNPSGADWVTTNRIAIHSTTPNIVLAGNGGGIYRSTNGGQTWTRVKTGTTLDVQFDPNVADRIVASGNGGFAYVSNDAGQTWTDAPKFFTNALRGRGGTARSEFAWAKSTPNLVYASVDNTDQTSGSRGEVYKSEDGGQTWTFLSSPKHLSQQGDYDNTIWVDPTNAANIVVGGLDLYRSIDGGLNFTRISTWQAAGPGLPQPHADHHQIVSPPNFSGANPVVYIGNDGGLVRSTNIFSASANGTSTWQNLNNELGITQFYGGAGSLAAGGKIIGGTQDNGDLRYDTGTRWTRIGGGDGGFAAVDPVNDATVYGEYVYASIRRYGGAGSGQICNGITEGKKDESNITYCGPNATEQTNFISPFILDPNSRDRMFVGANSLWVSDDVRTVAAPVWRAIKPPVTNPNSTRYINAIAVQNGNSNVIWVGHNASNTTGLPTQIFRTSNGLAATPDWTNVAATGMPTSAINRITIDPDNPNRVWVSYSGFSPDRLWVTDNGGSSWRSISAGLPAVTIHDMKRHPTQRDWLYVGAANGVYTSENSGVTWTSTNDGPNSVRVRELFWYDNFTLVAVTHGRGMFRVSAVPENGVISFQPTNYSVSEGAGSATLTVQRFGNIGATASVSYNTQSGTATAGADFTATTGTLSWPAGDGSTRVISIPIIDDTATESSESFTVTLSNPVGTTIGTATATVTITDNEQGVFPPNCMMPTTGWSVPTGANAGWQVATDSASEGTCSLKSSPIGDNARAQIAFTGNFVAGNVTFDRRVSSESTYDCLQFLIDGVAQNIGSNCSGSRLVGASGDVPWASVSVAITAGPHILTWSYVKDENTIEGLDAAWIDKLVLPLATSTANTAPQADLLGEGRSTLLWANTNGAVALWRYSGSSFVDSGVVLGPFPGWTLISTEADFDGDGKADLLWQRTDGAISIWLMNGTSIRSQSQFGPYPSWSFFSANSDFDGDGKTDLVWKRNDGAISIWLMNGGAQSSERTHGPFPGWTLLSATNDFDGNKKSDLLWRKDTGAVSLWLMNGANVQTVSPEYGPYPTWTLLSGSGDFDGDGKSDLLWEKSDGAVSVWLMNGANVTTQSNQIGPFAGWKIVPGKRDFDGDQKSDLLWQRTDGAASVWLMNGAQMPASTRISSPFLPNGAGWSLLSAYSDFNGDGKTDLVWQSAAGVVAIGLANGVIPPVPTAFGPFSGWSHFVGRTIP
jgi:photosystem II stability/assembly factor-like uncharacterized protein